MIEDFIPTYPFIEDKNFIFDISKRKEFNELRLDRDQTTQKRTSTQLLPHQLFAQRFFSPNTQYKEGLLWHEMGTGKTCVMSSIVEIAKSVFEFGEKAPRAVMFVPSDEIRRNHYKDISDKCTTELYTALYGPGEQAPKSGLTEEGKRQRINRAVASSYEILTYDADLAKIEKELNLPGGKARIQHRFANRIILLDEIHSIRIQSRDYFAGDEDEASNITKEKSKSQYKTLHEFLHLIKYKKLLGFTGTPIWDKSNEIASIANLFLSTEEQLPTGKKFEKEFFDEKDQLSPLGVTKLKKIFRGRIFYLRQYISDVKREEQGSPQPWLNYTKVYPTAMSDHQAEIAYQAKEVVKTHIGVKKDHQVKGGPVLSDARQASEFVFNDGTYGQEGFKKHVIVKGSIQNPQYYLDEEHKKLISRGVSKTKTFEENLAVRLENLRKFSAKYSTIIKLLFENPKEVAFIYTGDFVKGGGAILFALILQEFGFAKTSGVDMTSKDKTKNLRFGIVTSNPWTTHEPTTVSKLIDSFNNPENKYGEYIRLLIGSKKIAVGLTLLNTRQVHATNASFNKPTMDQAFGRVYRFGAHNAFDISERTLKIYRHVAVETDVGGDYSETPTIDIHLYKIAEEKEHKNVQIYRVLKEIAVDCAINYNRNVLPTDADGSRECDHQECEYKCEEWPSDKLKKDGNHYIYDIDEKDIVYSGYNLLYSEREEKELTDKIIDLFQTHFSLSLNALMVYLDTENKNLVLFTLDKIISTRTILRNRYGFKCYLKEQADTYFLDYSINPTAGYSENIYVSNPFIAFPTSFDDLINIDLMNRDKEMLCDFIVNPDEDKFSKLSFSTKILMFEYAYILKISENVSPLLDKLVKYIFQEEGDKFFTMKDKNIVHILHCSEFTGLSYNVMAANIQPNGKTRVFNQKTMSWEWLKNEITERQYISEISEIQKKKTKIGFENNDYNYYATISKIDKKFRIHAKTAKKGTPRGYVCNESTKPELFRVFYQLNYFPEKNDNYDTLSKRDLIARIEGITTASIFKDEIAKNNDRYSDDEMRQILTLLTMEVSDICIILQKWFSDNNLLYKI